MQKDKLKILLCSPDKHTGGISSWTRHILNYYQTNIKNDEEIDLQHYYNSSEKNIYANTPFIVRCVNGIKTYWIFYNVFRKLIKNQKIDIVHLCTSASISLTKDILLLRVAKKIGIKTIIHFHFGRIPDLYKKKNWEQKLLHKVIDLADKAIVIDETSYTTLLNCGYNNVSILQNPLSSNINDIILHNTNIKRQNRKIVFAGHVVKTKGVFELIEVCRELENIELKILGAVSDKTKEELVEIAGENNEWLDIVGEKPYEVVIKEMLSAGIFVLPTYTEGFPNVILEAMACGCPIIASSVGAIPEMLDVENNACGISVTPKDVLELKTEILYLLDNPKLAQDMGNAAKNRVSSMYSMEVVWDKLINIWIN